MHAKIINYKNDCEFGEEWSMRGFRGGKGKEKFYNYIIISKME